MYAIQTLPNPSTLDEEKGWVRKASIQKLVNGLFSPL